ncbi:iron-containing alcohol dehydrogenase [Peribacillus asahii]|uniref:iron-containing alcohol dehydrogenase n=1 Tax=Peribacillus asahii TaxID=228899 RepID=UPI00207A3E2F|nr:iron-containing alcohol dehydrogenase [Peribacillus asahii]USK70525.1 iron-containing alcohol dehydrogenase [Peribacillus asahii]
MSLNTFVIPEIIFGKGSIEQVGDACSRLGAKNVFIVSDAGVATAGWLNIVIQSCKRAGLAFSIYIDSTTNPKDREITAGCRSFLQHECDAIIGVGGGSALDAAKAIAILATNGGDICDYEGIDKIHSPLPPMVMVMTTAGSGSEVSQFSVIVDSFHQKKMTIISKSLVPDIAIIDPDTLTTKDAELTAATGMDVLTHAIESYVSIAATPLTDVQAKNALSLVSRYLRPSVASKNNKEAKEAMAMASLQAGLAFSNAILGATHAISHAIGGRYLLPHGEINTILLPHVMEFNRIASPQRFSELAEIMGIDTRTLTEQQAGNAAIQFVRDLSNDIGTPTCLGDVGITEEMIGTIGISALEDPCMITNPRDMSLDQIKSLLVKAL